MVRLLFVCIYILPMYLSAQQIDAESETPVRVLIWDEQQPEQKEAYPDFLGEVLAKHLKQFDDFIVKTANPDDPEQGLSAEALDNTDVLVWWGHRRHKEITLKPGRKLCAVFRQENWRTSRCIQHILLPHLWKRWQHVPGRMWNEIIPRQPGLM